MPLYPCKHPTCRAYVKRSGDYCAGHAAIGERENAERRRDRTEADRYYDQHVRDPEAIAFYHSAAWLACRALVLAEHPVCQRCNRAWSQHVHHIKPLQKCTDEEKLDPANLKALCQPCHNIEESETPP